MAILESFPEDAQEAMAYARLAEAADDRTEALARWDAFRERFPTSPIGWVQGAWLLRRLKYFEPAYALLCEAADRFPQESQVFLDLAWLETERKDWKEAAQRWRTALDRFPNHPIAEAGLGIALANAGIPGEAEDRLFAALQSHPDNEHVGVAFARLASDRGDWQEAACRWGAVLARFPGNNVARTLGAEAKLIAQLEAEISARELPGEEQPLDGNRPISAGSDINQGPPLSAARQAPPINPEFQARELMLRFEGLGANCEFGLVQRHFDAEPLGLLRWAGIGAEQLVAALREEFKGVGSQEQTHLRLAHGEYYTTDSKFDMLMHTFIREGTADQDRIFSQQCRRLKFLRSKMLDDLRAGDKIFIYKPIDGVMIVDQMCSILAAINGYGKNRLVVVMLEDALNVAGTTRKLSDQLMVGYVDRIYRDASVANPIAHAQWLSILQEAYSHFAACEAGLASSNSKQA